jgi:hypothetical protein
VLCMDGKAAWGVKVNGLTPFDMAKMAGTAEPLQKQLTATMTAIHRAQEEAYLATLEKVACPPAPPRFLRSMSEWDV